MKSPRLLTVLLAMAALPITASASDVQLEEAYLKGRPVTLNAQEREALAIAKLWRSNEQSQKPIVGTNGNVTYFFGGSQPVMICSPLEVCVIRLDPGEAITTLQAGDTTRWQITPTIVGFNGQQRTEIVVKPRLTGLVTSLYVGTTRRSYNIKLTSTRHQFIPFLDFIYPETMDAALASYREKVAKSRANQTLEVYEAKLEASDTANPAENEPLVRKRHVSELDFDYLIEGDTGFTPVRVYNDGVKTIIQMDPAIAHTDLPSLLVLDANNKQNLVNYRVIDHRFIVDQVFNRAVLIAGVGSGKQQVTITRSHYRKRGERDDDWYQN